MSLLDTGDPRPVHFMGIAGAGMSALAELLVRRGVSVTGCDGNTSTVVEDLQQLGIKVTVGHDPSHVEGVRAVVVTSAVPKDHPELEQARAQGVPVIRRAEALGQVVSGGGLVGIAGTHGKTTTTVMTTMALASAGLAPTGIVGGRVAEWGGNMSLGSDKLFVVEADEYDRSFLALSPTVAVVTNIEADHLDIYRDFADIHSTFAQYAKGARYIVLCGDDPGASTLPTPNTAEVIRYGIDSPDARLLATQIQTTPEGTRFSVVYDGDHLGEVTLSVFGRHNILNALAAIASGIALGVTVPMMTPGLAAFQGVERRFQRIGAVGGITIIDDYAHHPTEIRATLQAARTAFPDQRIVVAFQPHLYSRTRDFAREFADALTQADAIYLTEIYPAREAPIEGVSAELIVNHLRDIGAPLNFYGARNDLIAALTPELRSGDVVFTIGAGDITLSSRELLHALQYRSQTEQSSSAT